MNRFNAKMGDRICTQRVRGPLRAGERNGLRSTPAIVVNGQSVDVSLGFEKLEAAVHAALNAA